VTIIRMSAGARTTTGALAGVLTARLGSKQGDVANEKRIFVKKEGGVSQPRTGNAMSPRRSAAEEFEYLRGEDPRQKLVRLRWVAPAHVISAPRCNRMWAHFMAWAWSTRSTTLRGDQPPSNRNAPPVA